jgi:Tol biopolymer transport system component
MKHLSLDAAGSSSRWLFASLVALAIAAAGAGEARAAFPGTNGKLVFETNRDGNAEIYTMNADGTDRVDLTRNSADDTDPRWSADGSRIVFASNRSGNYQIYTMKADGSGVTRVTHDSNDDRRPTWTADGHILFQNGTFPNRAIFRINADGNGLQQLTPVLSDNATVAAAPRGGRIAFSSTRGDGTQRLYTARAAHQRPLCRPKRRNRSPTTDEHTRSARAAAGLVAGRDEDHVLRRFGGRDSQRA